MKTVTFEQVEQAYKIRRTLLHRLKVLRLRAGLIGSRSMVEIWDSITAPNADQVHRELSQFLSDAVALGLELLTVEQAQGRKALRDFLNQRMIDNPHMAQVVNEDLQLSRKCIGLAKHSTRN